MIWIVIRHRIKDVPVRRITVKKAILNLRLADRKRFEIKGSMARNEAAIFCINDVILDTTDLSSEGILGPDSHTDVYFFA